MRLSTDNLDGLKPPATMLNTQRFAAGRLGYAVPQSRPDAPIGRGGQAALEFSEAWTSKSSGIGLRASEFFERFFSRKGRSSRFIPHLEKHWLIRRHPAFSRFAPDFSAPFWNRDAPSPALLFPSRVQTALPTREIVTRKTILSFLTQTLPLRESGPVHSSVFPAVFTPPSALTPSVLQRSAKAQEPGFAADGVHRLEPGTAESTLPSGREIRAWRDRAPFMESLPLSRPPVPQASWLGASPSAPPPAQWPSSAPAAAPPFSEPLPRPLTAPLGTLPRPSFTLLPELIYGARTFAAPAMQRHVSMPGSPAVPGSPSTVSALDPLGSPSAGTAQPSAARYSHSKSVTQLLAVTAALALLQILPAGRSAQAATVTGKPSALTASLPLRGMPFARLSEQPLTRQAAQQIPVHRGVEVAGQKTFQNNLTLFQPVSLLTAAASAMPPFQTSAPKQPWNAVIAETKWSPSAFTVLTLPQPVKQGSREQPNSTDDASKMSAIFREPLAAPPIHALSRQWQGNRSIVWERIPELSWLTGAKHVRFLPENQRLIGSLSDTRVLVNPSEADSQQEQRFFGAPASQRVPSALTLPFLPAADRSTNRPPAPNPGGAGNGYAGALLSAPALLAAPASLASQSSLTAPSFRVVPLFSTPVPPLLGARGLPEVGSIGSFTASHTRTETWDTTRLVEETLNAEFQPQLLSLVQSFLSSWQSTATVPSVHQVTAVSPGLTFSSDGTFSAAREAADSEAAVSPIRSRFLLPALLQRLLRFPAGDDLPERDISAVPVRGSQRFALGSLLTSQSAASQEMRFGLRTQMAVLSEDGTSGTASRSAAKNRAVANFATTPFDPSPLLRTGSRSEGVSAARSLLHLSLPTRLPESQVDFEGARSDTHIPPSALNSLAALKSPVMGKIGALPSPRAVSMTLPVPAPVSAPEENWAIQRVVSGGQSAALSVPQAAQQGTNLASQEKGAAANDVHLLANEVWSLLKRRLETEAERIGRR